VLGTPPTVAQEAPQAQETPLQTWFSSWLDYLSANLPAIFIVVAVLVGILLLAKGGIKQMLVFAIGAALAFLLLTNLEAVAELFSNELPLPPDGAPGPPESPDPAPSPD
jgi:hypothetical protein